MSATKKSIKEKGVSCDRSCLRVRTLRKRAGARVCVCIFSLSLCVSLSLSLSLSLCLSVSVSLLHREIGPNEKRRRRVVNAYQEGMN